MNLVCWRAENVRSVLILVTPKIKTNYISYWEEKGLWLRSVTNVRTKEKSRKQRDNKKRQQNFDYTKIADLLRTVNNNSYPTS